MKSDALITNPYGFIALNRKIVALGDICVAKDGIQTGPFGSQLHSADYVDVGTPIIMVEHLGENIIKSESTPFVSDEDIKRLVKYTMKSGDIIFSRVGYVDKRALVKDVHEGWLFSGSLLRIRPDLNLVDATYLSYFFGFPRLKKYMGDVSVGATRPSINTSILKSIPVVLPELRVQKVIGEILANIDDKIACNHTLSKTLEDIAQTIFKSWFIDFDPVKAKMAGEKPAGMDAATTALFPNTMEESELGIIPKGWTINVISDFGKVVTGKTPSTKVPEYWGEQIPFVTIPDMHGQMLVTSTARALSQEGADSQRSQNIPAGSTMVTCIATPGLVGYATKYCQTNQQINSVIPKVEQSSIWLFWHLRGLIPTLIRNSGIGTVFANLNKSDFSNIKSITPEMALRNAFSRIAEPIMELLETLNIESQYLREIRDALLPRLISGELQIPEEILAS